MTRKQAECLALIAKHIECNGQPPTLAEIMVGCGLKSKSGPSRLVNALEERGFIRRFRGRARSIQIIDPGEVKLNAEIFRLVSDYARQEKIGIDTAVNSALRDWFGAAA